MNLYFLDLIVDSKVKEREKVEVYFEDYYHYTKKVEYCYDTSRKKGRMIVLKHKKKKICGMDLWHDHVTFYYNELDEICYELDRKSYLVHEDLSNLKDKRGKNFNHRCVLMFQILHY
jgi:hypothetical protein